MLYNVPDHFSLFCSAVAERWLGVLSSVVRSVYSFLLQFHYLTVGSGL